MLARSRSNQRGVMPRVNPRVMFLVVAMGMGCVGNAVALAGSKSSDVAEAPLAYEIVAAAAVDILPTQIHPFFRDRINKLQQSATDHLESSEPTVLPAREASRHVVALNAWLSYDGTSPPKGMIKKLFRRPRGKKQTALPATLMGLFRELIRAFESGRRDDVTRLAGRVIHFATDAALPFHTTDAGHGSKIGRDPPGTSTDGAPMIWHQTPARRIELALVHHAGERFSHEVCVWEGRYEGSGEPESMIADTLLGAHQWAKPLLIADESVRTELGIDTRQGWQGRLGNYNEKIAKRVGDIMVSRMAAGALLAANLIGSAWEQAGRPVFGGLESSAEAERTTPPVSGKAIRRFVGSRNSNIFHFATCPHARRIKDENLVRFRDIKTVRAAGRSACRTCKPPEP